MCLAPGNGCEPTELYMSITRMFVPKGLMVYSLECHQLHKKSSKLFVKCMNKGEMRHVGSLLGEPGIPGHVQSP